MKPTRPVFEILISLFVGAVCLQVDAQEKSVWEGTLNASGQKLPLQFVISRDSHGAFSGRMISIAQGGAEVPLSRMEINDDQVIMELETAGAKFEARINENKTEIAGTWSQLGNKWALTIKKIDSKHVESWTGIMKAGGRSFDFQLRVFEEPDGQKTAKLDSFSESLIGLPVVLKATQEGLIFEVEISAARYEGKYNTDKTKLQGKWLQSGGEFPLDFDKIALADTRKKANAKRPQNPKKPYPYEEEEVSFRNEAADITLAGTLTKPNGDGLFPAMILISGSGAQDRDETIYEHKPFWIIADHLTRHGIAVLRYDERGVKKSTGSFSGATSEDFSQDVEAGIEFLKKDPRIRPEKIGLIGHSEGGLIAPMIAARRPDVAMIVMLAGPGVDGGVIGMSQSRAIAKAAGASEEVLNAQDRLLEGLFEAVRKTDKPVEAQAINKLVEQFKSEIPEEQGSDNIEAQLKTNLQRLNNPWFRFFVKYDPAPALENVDCPTLVLNGTKDLQVLVDLNVDAIQRALERGGNEDFEVHKLENLNHLFQTTEGTGLMNEYGHLEETFSPIALKLMTEWINARVD